MGINMIRFGCVWRNAWVPSRSFRGRFDVIGRISAVQLWKLIYSLSELFLNYKRGKLLPSDWCPIGTARWPRRCSSSIGSSRRCTGTFHRIPRYFSPGTHSCYGGRFLGLVTFHAGCNGDGDWREGGGRWRAYFHRWAGRCGAKPLTG